MIQCYINGQELKLKQNIIASDTIDYLTAKFEFSSDWDGLVKFAHIKKAGTSTIYDILLHNDEIVEGDHLNLEAGQYELWVHGNKTESLSVTKRITTTIVCLFVTKTGTLNGQPLPEIPLSAAEQILGVAQDAKDVADATLETLETMTANAQTLPAGSSATAEYDAENNVMNFGIPKGETGGGGGGGSSVPSWVHFAKPEEGIYFMWFGDSEEEPTDIIGYDEYEHTLIFMSGSSTHGSWINCPYETEEATEPNGTLTNKLYVDSKITQLENEIMRLENIINGMNE